MGKKTKCKFCGDTCRQQTCSICGFTSCQYQHTFSEYRGAIACKDCRDTLKEKRDTQRSNVIEITEASLRNQRNGAWHAGGHRTMKTDSEGKPMLSAKDIKEPLPLQDYEDGKL